MTWEQFCRDDDRQHAIAKLENNVYQANLKAEQANDIVWALVERLKPELLNGLPENNQGPPQLIERLYEIAVTSDDIADMLLK